jgi:hypothetical protein
MGEVETIDGKVYHVFDNEELEEAPVSTYKWFHVKDMLPEDYGFYLVCHDNTKVFKCDYWSDGEWMDAAMTKLVNQLCEDGIVDEYEITHWCKLPNAPVIK